MLNGISGQLPIYPNPASERGRSPAREAEFRREAPAAPVPETPSPESSRPSEVVQPDPQRVRERFEAQAARLQRETPDDLPLRNRQALDTYAQVAAPNDPAATELLSGIDIRV
ncbi:MAG: hypothetical protein LPK85_03185 [Gammaproteobacteria bacterium]|nr:hypothetical protein [Gammaproteobacteria bacterium]